ncbi:membrane protein [Thiohalobacter sp. COW1]|uniref:DUF2061 domain-containing protein n=1 Tax=Thiohalobacter thiocyanaticus TaxID=585455 RepID=A0A1Z4VPI1_9GAMM|nr:MULTISPECIES: DUF2061 domain-containing protein [Thiohalobacter]BAZ93517.1 uncharacterized protein FOKN1_1118 [Thiohalobacter thiocyanaticus]BCO31441.1 membrane protein [Thiohalobacter sp. COW1]
MTKTLSFAAVHFSVAFSVGYLMTGSLAVGGAIALVEPLVNTLAYHIHEQIWRRRENGRGAVQSRNGLQLRA